VVADRRATRPSSHAAYTGQWGQFAHCSTTGCEYDANRNRTTLIDPEARCTTYGYDPDGRLIRLTDPNGNVTTWERGAIVKSGVQGPESSGGLV